MKKLFKILVPLVLVILIGNQNKIKTFFNSEETRKELDLVSIEEPNIEIGTKAANKDSIDELNHRARTKRPKTDYLVNDFLYRWDQKLLDWVRVNSSEKMLCQEQSLNSKSLGTTKNSAKAIEIDWEFLQNIRYQLKYFQKIEMESFAPVFSQALKEIDGKKVIIEGYVIPVDAEGDLLALSANSFSSCFFCGNASPSSVMSLYLKKKKSFKTDAYKKFQGVLNLNYNDPEEFYYILKEVVPII